MLLTEIDITNFFLSVFIFYLDSSCLDHVALWAFALVAYKKMGIFMTFKTLKPFILSKWGCGAGSE